MDFGTLEVGGIAHAQTLLPLGRVPVLFELEVAPAGVEAPERIFSRPKQPTWLRLRWTPDSVGALDDELVYRMDIGPRATRFRIRLQGEALTRDSADEDAGDDGGSSDGAFVSGDASTDAALPCQRALDCDDSDPCTEDTCQPALGCQHTPTDEGKPCGAFDCTLGHFCSSGRCAEVDMRSVSDGMACDDGDPCTRDGQCRSGLCYAAQEPRQPRVYDTLYTFGDDMSDAAHAAGTYVFVGLDRVDVVVEEDGVLRHRKRLALPDVRFAESAGAHRFLLRTSEGKVSLLETRDPSAPKLTPLSHIVPVAAARIANPSRLQFEDKWAVVGDYVVISTSTWPPDYTQATYYAATIAPIAQGPARAFDLPLYRMDATEEGLLAWAQPGLSQHGDDYLGVARVAAGVVTAEARVKLSASQTAGCGSPKFVAAFGNTIAVLSDDDFPSGTSHLCLWRVDATAQSLSLAAAHPIYERFQEPALALDAEAVYLTTRTLWGPGFAGGLIGKGQLKRIPLASLLANNDPIPYPTAPLAGPYSGSLLKLDAGRLLVIGDSLSVLRPGGEAVTGPGHGSVLGALGFDAGKRALVGGRSSFGLLDVESTPPRLKVSEWQTRYPKGGALNADLRLLRAEGRTKNLTPASQSPHIKITSFEQLTAQPGADGRLRITEQTRSLSLGYGWVSSAVTEGAYTLFVEGSLLVFKDQDTTDPSRKFDVQSWTRGNENFPELFLRASATPGLLTMTHGDRLSELDPLRDDAAKPDAGIPMQTIAPARDLPGGQFPWIASSMALAEDHVLRGERTQLVLHSRTARFAPVSLRFERAADDAVVTIPEFGPGWALVYYRDRDGQSWLVQVSVRDGELEELSRLATAAEVVSADRVEEHWLLSTAAGAQLVDLQCWPGAER